jgi:hypothetical protein
MRSFSIILSLLLASNCASARSDECSITGQITSARNGKPLSSASVMLRGTVTGSIADSSGRYLIRHIPPGKHSVRVMHLGYEIADTVVELQNGISTVVDIALQTTCSVDESKARSDIAQKTVRLLLIGSLMPQANSPEDDAFEKHYGVEYFDYGCTPPAHECVIEYNRTIFQYLDERYGTGWRKSVRGDVVGLE